MRVLDDSIQVRTFDDAAALKAHYRDVRHRLMVPRPKPVAVSVPMTAPVLKPAEQTVMDLPAFLPTRGAEWFEVRAIDRHKIPALIAMTATQFGLREIDITGHRRHVQIAYVRQVAMWLCRRFSIYSYPAIAERFGGRDHTTAIHAERKIAGLIDANGIEVSSDTPAEWLAALRPFQPEPYVRRRRK